MAVKVKGLLVEGKDGHEYLLGIGPRTRGKQTERPTIWRVTGTTAVPLEQTREASVTVRSQLGLAMQLQAGFTHDEHVKWAVLESVTAFLKKFFAEARW